MSLQKSFAILIIIGMTLLMVTGCGIKITSPPDGSQFTQGDLIRLKGSRRLGASSDYDFEWSSNIDGQLGSGDELLIPDSTVGRGLLSEGEHIITAEHPGSYFWLPKWTDSITLSVTPLECPVPDIDPSSVPSFVYEVLLGTVLRGILIDNIAAQLLDISPGYYHITAFRKSNLPHEWVIALCINKHYTITAAGIIVLPHRNEEWVFSVIEENVYNSEGWKFTGYDFHGHKFSFEISFDSDCLTVVSANLDCVHVGMSTEDLAGSLSTCGWTSEPVWTN